MPGFANQKLDKFFDCDQEVDNSGSLSLFSILARADQSCVHTFSTMVLCGQKSLMF